MKNVLITILLLFDFQNAVNGQEQFPALNTRVEIGNSVPDYMFRNILNYKTRTARISDFRGKLLLLDFWATWCTPCIAGMPGMHELQEKFKDRIQIILVNDNESPVLVDRFVANRKKTASSRITLPVAYSDSLLSKSMFPHPGIPAIFWIDSEGILRYKTSKVEVNERNIGAFLNGKPIAFESVTPMVSPEKMRNDSSILWRSEIRKGAAGSSPVSRLFVMKNGFSGVATFNTSVLDMIRFAYGMVHPAANGFGYIERQPVNRTIVDSRPGGNYGRHMKNHEQSTEVYSYELVAPLYTSGETMQEVMRADLEKWFDFRAVREKRLVKYLVLTSLDTTLIAWKGGAKVCRISDTELELNGLTIEYMLGTIDSDLESGRSNFLPPYPIVDETDFKGPVGGIHIESTDMNDYKALDRALSKYGLRLQLMDGKIEMLSIRQNRLAESRPGSDK